METGEKLSVSQTDGLFVRVSWYQLEVRQRRVVAREAGQRLGHGERNECHRILPYENGENGGQR